MNNKAHLRPKDFDSNGDIIPMSWKEEKGDLISRDALKEKIQEIVETEMPIDEKWAVGLRHSLKLIDNAPTVDAIPNEEGYEMYNKGYMSGYEMGKKERPKGEWVKNDFHDFGSMGDWDYRCSICGKVYRAEYNFCPNCGVKMENPND